MGSSGSNETLPDKTKKDSNKPSKDKAEPGDSGKGSGTKNKEPKSETGPVDSGEGSGYTNKKDNEGQIDKPISTEDNTKKPHTTWEDGDASNSSDKSPSESGSGKDKSTDDKNVITDQKKTDKEKEKEKESGNRSQEKKLRDHQESDKEKNKNTWEVIGEGDNTITLKSSDETMVLEGDKVKPGNEWKLKNEDNNTITIESSKETLILKGEEPNKQPNNQNGDENGNLPENPGNGDTPESTTRSAETTTFHYTGPEGQPEEVSKQIFSEEVDNSKETKDTQQSATTDDNIFWPEMTTSGHRRPEYANEYSHEYSLGYTDKTY